MIPPLSPADFAAGMEATWPPFDRNPAGPWIIRHGAGGGKRVSATSAEGDWRDSDLEQAEAAMLALDQEPLFVIWPWDTALDGTLALRGYQMIDPVLGYAAPVSTFAPPARMTTFPHWPPLQIARDIWAEGRIGPGRLAVMERTTAPKAVILSRTDDKPSGAAFVALYERTTFIHAVEVRPALRRKGAARQILAAAARWAAEQGADRLALAVTEANASARALYASLGLQVVGLYHYRAKEAAKRSPKGNRSLSRPIAFASRVRFRHFQVATSGRIPAIFSHGLWRGRSGRSPIEAQSFHPSHPLSRQSSGLRPAPALARRSRPQPHWPLRPMRPPWRWTCPPPHLGDRRARGKARPRCACPWALRRRQNVPSARRRWCGQPNAPTGWTISA